jgi:uncharacterized protein
MWTLIIFTRWPVAGKTKTRLIPVYGADGAASIHLQLLTQTVSAAREIANEARVVAAVADLPSDADPKTLFANDWARFEQRGSNLGERMANAIDDALQMNPETTAVVLVGVDCPDYSAALFRDAVAALAVHDVVFAPTEDGGYGLVGVQRRIWHAEVRRALFEDIAWGTAQVMSSSIDRIGLLVPRPTTTLLQTIWDVDTPADVERAIKLGVLNAERFA